MIASPWDLILTVVFFATGLICLGDLIARRIRRPARTEDLADEELIDINHAVMSAAMILMTWVTVLDAVTWAQIALFAIFALALLPALARAHGFPHRVELVGHVVLNAAMIWMLAAMPLLMAGMDMGGDGGSAHAGHHGGGDEMGLMATPVWADVVNTAFIVACTLGAAWWLYRAAVARGHRMHALCHALMAAGMGAMLWLMNL
ncbi:MULTISPECIES: DUF5134 domain-containing protein [unclassified Microbacterium]|uniref:DUF5134 domain-containing protein n=1 Tax=unclassified Microbacterium TaxID=2609290 RepID=UPI0023064489|nr:DUF5134 domain-containing protein [Microbacterium sp. nov. GSS16]WCD93038.1 DUF5134 domain-containing protein [Microbacterium sp. nov. GSS16]